MKKLLIAMVLTLILTLSLSSSGSTFAMGKTWICHYPPGGGPVQYIEVSDNSLLIHKYLHSDKLFDNTVMPPSDPCLGEIVCITESCPFFESRRISGHA